MATPVHPTTWMSRDAAGCLDDRIGAEVDQMLRQLLLEGWRAWGPVFGWAPAPRHSSDPRIDRPAAFLWTAQGVVQPLWRAARRHHASLRLRAAAALLASHAEAIQAVDVVEELAADPRPLIAHAATDLLAEEAASIDAFGGGSATLETLDDNGRLTLLHTLAAWRRLDHPDDGRAAHDRAIVRHRFERRADGRMLTAAGQFVDALEQSGEVTAARAIDALSDGHVLLFETVVARIVDVEADAVAAAAAPPLLAALTSDRHQQARLAWLLACARTDDADEAGRIALSTFEEAGSLDQSKARAEILLLGAPSDFRDAMLAAGAG